MLIHDIIYKVSVVNTKFQEISFNLLNSLLLFILLILFFSGLYLNIGGSLITILVIIMIFISLYRTYYYCNGVIKISEELIEIESTLNGELQKIYTKDITKIHTSFWEKADGKDIIKVTIVTKDEQEYYVLIHAYYFASLKKRIYEFISIIEKFDFGKKLLNKDFIAN